MPASPGERPTLPALEPMDGADDQSRAEERYPGHEAARRSRRARTQTVDQCVGSNEQAGAQGIESRPRVAEAGRAPRQDQARDAQRNEQDGKLSDGLQSLTQQA